MYLIGRIVYCLFARFGSVYVMTLFFIEYRIVCYKACERSQLIFLSTLWINRGNYLIFLIVVIPIGFIGTSTSYPCGEIGE